jgi:hypothetical protein
VPGRYKASISSGDRYNTLDLISYFSATAVIAVYIIQEDDQNPRYDRC